MDAPKIERDEVAAAMSAHRELGPQYELELAQSLVDRINSVIDARLAAEAPRRRQAGPDWAQMALGLGSVALAIPLTALVASVTSRTAPLILLFALIAIVNIVYAGSKASRNRD
ncbi:hypothetical protein [Sphaerisporangium fuscum]|uniref:hypothetical protein n=1 Tax=Sphaerisporangium fuscum TaxID=2835868 RepID=UPI001BDC780E|nr:hypothetical protein [Sphaerisporangium fuscum]